MPRRPDETRRPELLDRIVEHLLDRPLAAVTLRTLADGIGVSTYTLVYHFGSKAELVDAIVDAVEARVRAAIAVVGGDPLTLEEYLRGYEEVWAWNIDPRNLHLRRLQVEAGMLESVDAASATNPVVRQGMAYWNSAVAEALQAFGVAEPEARAEARAMVAQMYGFSVALVVTGEVDELGSAVRAAVRSHAERIAALAAGAPGDPGAAQGASSSPVDVD